MTRFRPPTASDDYANCQGCGDRFHYERLTGDGFCPYCVRPKNECQHCALLEKKLELIHINIQKIAEEKPDCFAALAIAISQVPTDVPPSPASDTPHDKPRSPATPSAES